MRDATMELFCVRVQKINTSSFVGQVFSVDTSKCRRSRKNPIKRQANASSCSTTNEEAVVRRSFRLADTSVGDRPRAPPRTSSVSDRTPNDLLKHIILYSEYHGYQEPGVYAGSRHRQDQGQKAHHCGGCVCARFRACFSRHYTHTVCCIYSLPRLVSHTQYIYCWLIPQQSRKAQGRE